MIAGQSDPGVRAMGVRVRWHKGSYFLFLNLGGRRKAIKVGTDKRVANAAAAKLRKLIARGEYRIPDQARATPTFAELARDWLARYPVTHAVRPATMENYRSFTEHHLLPHFGAMRVDDVTPRAIEDFIMAKRSPGGSARFQGKALSPQSLRVGLVALRLILRRAVTVGVLTANPAADLGRLPRADGQRVDPFEPRELRAILEAAERTVSPDFSTLLQLWAQAGARAGEVLGLQEHDVDVAAGTILVRRTFSRGRLGPPKAGGERRVSFLHPTTDDSAEWRPRATARSREVLARLQRRKVAGLDPAAFLFGRGRTPRRSYDLHRDWRRALLAAGVRYREPEQLRHSFASIMLSRNAPLLYVAEVGGWASAHVLLKVYARWLPSQTGVALVQPHGAATQAQPGRRR
jgi:integrase